MMCDYSDEIGLLEKILVSVSVLEAFPDTCLELEKSFLHAYYTYL
jgi:hypothetical protein